MYYSHDEKPLRLSLLSDKAEKLNYINYWFEKETGYCITLPH